MNKTAIYTAGSFVIGAVVGALTLDNIWSKRFDRETDKMAQEIKLDYARYFLGEDGKPPIHTLGKSEMSREEFEDETDTVVRSVQDAQKSSDKPPTDYTSSYRGSSEDQPIMNLDKTAAASLIKKASVQSEAIIDEMNYDGNRDIEENPVEHHNVFEDNPMPPDFDDREEGGVYILTTEEFMEEDDKRPDGYQTLTVTWFEYDNTLIDDSDGGHEAIISIEDTITEDVLNHFGWDPKAGKDTIFVRNEKSQIDFEVTRDERSYAEAIAGFIEEDEKPRRKRPEDD